jgi:hypothetical protein
MDVLISQVMTKQGQVVVARQGSVAKTVVGVSSVVELATKAISAGQGLVATIDKLGLGQVIDLETAYADASILSPITHADPAHLHITGTGLTHLGSAATRNSMHTKASDDATMTDSMKMFRMGIEGGRPKPGQVGVQPEWFYKGNGTMAAAPGDAIVSPSFALDGGEEPELAGIYMIAPDGTPFRIGFALGNEFSDHVTERINYLFLAHSKLRQCAFGPEILIGDPPSDIQGMSRILRDGKCLWEKPFLTGEANMSHTLANLEHHHFKYDLFRQPGDVHVHMFGTATLSFADGITPMSGDVFEISAPDFGLSLRNRLVQLPKTEGAITVKML